MVPCRQEVGSRDKATDMPPTYSLSDFQRLATCTRTRSVTMGAYSGAQSLGLGRDDIWRCIRQLKASDFYKTMPASAAEGLWQDVYRVEFGKHSLYVKIQILPCQKAHVISFKER